MKARMTANTTTVIRTRAVRDSIRGKEISASKGFHRTRAGSIPQNFRALRRDDDTNQFQAVIEPHPPITGLAAETELGEVTHGAVDVHFLPRNELDAHQHRCALAGHKNAKLDFARLALEVAVVLAAGGGQIAPGQDFAVQKEEVVENRGGRTQQERLLERLFARTGGELLRKKLAIGRDRGFGLAGAKLVPFIMAKLARSAQFQLGRLRAAILRFQLRLRQAAAGTLVDRKCLGSNAFAADVNAEGTRIHRLAGFELGGRCGAHEGKQHAQSGKQKPSFIHTTSPWRYAREPPHGRSRRPLGQPSYPRSE